MKIINVLILQKSIPHYRIDFFNHLNSFKEINLSVFSLNDEPLLSSNVNQYKFNYKKIKKFNIFSLSYYIFSIPKNFIKNDVIIVVGNIRHIHNYFLLLYCKIKKIKIIWWGIWNMPGRNNSISLLRKKIASLFDHIIVYSDLEKKNAINDLIKANKISSFNNSIKISNTIISDSKKNIIFKLLYVGRLTNKPKLELAIKVIYYLLENNYKIKFNIVGDGPEKNNLKKIIKLYNLQDCVFLHGPIYNEKNLKKFFVNSDLFIYPGAIGLSIFHSFSYGLPVITHDNPKYQAPEFYLFKNNYNGISFKYNDIDDLKFKIKNFIDNGDKYKDLKKNALETVCQNFTFEDSVNNFKDAILRA